jgi:hypothetical protein
MINRKPKLGRKQNPLDNDSLRDLQWLEWIKENYIDWYGNRLNNVIIARLLGYKSAKTLSNWKARNRVPDYAVKCINTLIDTGRIKIRKEMIR